MSGSSTARPGARPGLVAIVRYSTIVFGLLMVSIIPVVAAASVVVSLLTLRMGPVGPFERFLIPVVAVFVLGFAALVLLATPV